MPRRVNSHPVVRTTTPGERRPRPSPEAPAETGRAWAPRSVARPRARAVDGNAFCARALGDIRARVARGEKVKVVFDIDNTLSDGRTRTLAVGQAWDKLNGTHYFSGVPPSRIGHDAGDTSVTLGIPPEQRAAFATYWEKQFWAPESFVHDAPIKDTVALVKAAASAGAEIVYLTGRIAALEPATIAQLQRFGLPGVDAEHVVTKKDVSVKTTPYRTGWLKEHAPEATAFFFTESRREIADAQANIPGLACVLLKSPFGGDLPVRADTPVFRAD
jgi:hypothetical protein